MANRKRSAGYKAAINGAKGIVRILVYLLIIVFIVFLGKTAYTYGYAIFNEEAMAEAPGEDVVIEIPEGATVNDIGQILKDRGLIENVNIFIAQERVSAYHGDIDPGIYTLNTSETPTEMMEIMAADEEGTS